MPVVSPTADIGPTRRSLESLPDWPELSMSAFGIASLASSLSWSSAHCACSCWLLFNHSHRIDLLMDQAKWMANVRLRGSSGRDALVGLGAFRPNNPLK
jgi:hypothetical protein